MRIIIIGAGAAGLQAGRRLSAVGHSVIILEAGAQPGGRILTLPAGSGSFTVPVECGAEFVHGDLPLSLALAKEAKIDLQPVASEMVRLDHGAAEHRNLLSQDWGKLMPRMAMLSEDKPLADFLESEFPGERYAALRDSVGRMAEGYDLADLRTVSTKWLFREWSAEEEQQVEYRPAGGYRRLIDFPGGGVQVTGLQVVFFNGGEGGSLGLAPGGGGNGRWAGFFLGSVADDGFTGGVEGRWDRIHSCRFETG